MLGQIIGNFTLNLSTILYMVVYMPQLFHNKKSGQLFNLSLNFHIFLFISCLTDLIYGFGLAMPWQYILVSIMGVIYLTIQHKQLWKIHHQRNYFMLNNILLFLLCTLIPTSLLYHFSYAFFIYTGYIAQITSVGCAIPQIYKNIETKNSILALNINYLALNFLSSLCDNISAWTLHWPTPSKAGSFIALLMCSTLVMQKLKLRPTPYNLHKVV